MRPSHPDVTHSSAGGFPATAPCGPPLPHHAASGDCLAAHLSSLLPTPTMMDSPCRTRPRKERRAAFAKPDCLHGTTISLIHIVGKESPSRQQAVPSFPTQKLGVKSNTGRPGPLPRRRRLGCMWSRHHLPSASDLSAGSGSTPQHRHED